MKKTLLTLSVLFLTACVSNSDKIVVHNKTLIEDSLNNKKFIVDSINNKKIMYNKKINISFKDNKNSTTGFVSGTTGCNRFFADYIVMDDYISFAEIKTTKKSCLNDTNAQLEKTILSTIENNLKINFVNGNVELLNEKNNSTLILKNYRKIKK